MADRAPGPTGLTRLLLDVRIIIGGLFCAYGLIITVAGLLATPSAIAKAVAVNINLWTGLAMLVVGALFFGWAVLRPLRRGTPGS